MNEKLEELNELEIEKILWLIFLFLSALNIYGDNIQELFIKSNNQSLEQESKKIFLFTIAISLGIYIYFTYAHYKDFKKTEYQTEEYNLSLIRLIGNILVVVGVILVLYYEIKEANPQGTPIT